MKKYLFDTHALIFWSQKTEVSESFIHFFDQHARSGYLYASAVNFWETALLSKKGKIQVRDIRGWQTEIMEYSNIKILTPSASEMIESTLLPDYHKDPFDRLLITQAQRHAMMLVTKDSLIKNYEVKTIWK